MGQEQTQTFLFKDAKGQGKNILIIGLGYFGCEVLNYLIDSETEGVEYLALDISPEILKLYGHTPHRYDNPEDEEHHALTRCRAPHKFFLGGKSIEKFRADWELRESLKSEKNFALVRKEEKIDDECEYDDESEMTWLEERANDFGGELLVGLNAAKASASLIESYTAEADIVFVIRYMTDANLGAAPVVSSIAKKTGAVVIEFMSCDSPPIATYPPQSESAKTVFRIMMGLLVSVGDIYIELLEKSRGRFLKPEKKIRLFIQGITDIFRRPGEISLDFQDFKEVIDKGADLGVGFGKGRNKVKTGIKAAIKNFPKDAKAKMVLVNFVTGPDTTLSSLTSAMEILNDTIDTDAKIIWGLSDDESMRDTARVTVLIGDWIQQEVNGIV
ncbi:MAG: hypothetical protein FWG22_05960 [Prolixibacteraceae bacterium]|nr:hypothetical protein [Prolixibacteraceae bacterium]